MTGAGGAGAPGSGDAARNALGDLVMAATVRIHQAGQGYGLDEPAAFLGSGFFVAPNWVLTCAHVACKGQRGEVTVVHEQASGPGMSAVAGHVVAMLPDIPAPATGNWPTPDLALIRLNAPADHECVYVSERPVGYYGGGKVLYTGWTEFDGRLEIMYGELDVEGTIGGRSTDVQLRLGGNDLPRGVSGGPVVDPQRGEVIGIVKSRSHHARGGTSIGLEHLRTLPVPDQVPAAEHEDPYQSVFQAHDRYHRDHQRHPATRRPTWTHVQSGLGARPGRTLSPVERAQLLGRLADLPPPVSTRSLLDILEDLPDFEPRLPAPAPRGWRDGLGALYESVGDDDALHLVLQYALRVKAAERPYVAPGTPDAEDALGKWVWETAQRLSGPQRRAIAELRFRGMGSRRTRIGRGEEWRTGARTAVVPDGTVLMRPHAAQPAVLVELEQRHWAPDQCDWSVSVFPPGAETRRLAGAEQVPLAELAEHLAAPLTEAFRQSDRPERPAVLQVALSAVLFHRLKVDGWRLGPDAPPVGAQRPVVLRCLDRDRLAEDDLYAEDADDAEGRLPGGADPFALEEERRDRWRWLHTHRARGEIVDCDEGLREPVPPVEQLRGLSHGSVPVLCRYGDDRYDGDALALHRIVRAGFSVALWRHRLTLPETVCGEYHRGALDEIAGPPDAGWLPEVVSDLRRKVRAGRPETFWADGLVLMYDDPQQPLPGSGDLLEAP